MIRNSGLITQFSEDVPATTPSICERKKCGRLIAPGENRHYIAGYNSETGKHVCDRCIAKYQMNPATISRSESQASLQVDAVDVRRHVNAGRQKGATQSVRRVTAIGGTENSGGRRQFWATQAYQGIIEDRIIVRYKVLREVPGKDKGALVRNLIEGNPNIRADATPSSLRESGIATMEPKIIHALRGFQLKWENIVLREISNSVDLAREPPNVPYFYARCLTGKAKGKDGAHGFRKPTRPFELAFVIDSEQWEVIEHYLVQRELEKETEQRSIRDPHRDSDSRFLSSDDEIQPPSPSDYQLNSASFEGGVDPNSKSNLSTSKRSRTDSLAAPTTPPPSKRRVIPAYESPNREQLRNALTEGGSSFALISGQALTLSERIEFFQISNRPLNELIATVGAGKFQGFICNPACAEQGSIVMEKDNYLGIGSFKTAHPGYLTLVHLASEGLGTERSQSVAVKRMYVRRTKATTKNPDGWAITRLTPTDEYKKTLMEANILQWAVSLMTFTFSFIHHFIGKSRHPPPFDIPDVRFVHAGVALVHQPSLGPIAKTQSTICRSYLVEELINKTTDGFQKFINNGSAASALPAVAEPSLHNLADFLSFTQHVQYYKSGGLVYLSDLQGTVERLTDPQIMTSPTIGDGVDLFGDGNVPAAFAAFPAEHICNKFCRWFELPRLENAGDSD
ncbi:hypothetical protein K438DRAFT_1747225 [Mycena galopus ATCC 62051]|nr:hypothetical protein K438DRAFT_1747225 [Mycena galopus ATCC 62051]